MNKKEKAELIATILRTDPLVKSETVAVDEGTDYIQVVFYTKHDEETDFDAGPTREIEQKIVALGGVDVHMNDCEGCYGEGVVWFD